MDRTDVGRSRPCTPRLFVCTDRDAADTVERELRTAGWRIARSAPPLGQPAARPPSVVLRTGPLGTDDVGTALELLSRSISVLALVPERSTAVDVWDQGRRLASVEWFDERTRPICHGLGDEHLSLLRSLATGATVGSAADACHLSDRTAARRLSEARSVLGTRTNGEAALIIAARLEQLADEP